MPFAELRREYMLSGLDESEVSADPFAQFDAWFRAAVAAKVIIPNAMALATADRETGRASVRAVLLKGCDAAGLVFYTSFESRKANEILANPQASVLFNWMELERQVRVEGRVEKVSDAQADAYFRSRPLGSRLGAWASAQSHRVPNRAALEARYAQARALHGEDPPRPPRWGGYRLVPDGFEFWQGRENRLHDRIGYRLAVDGRWRIERLAP